MVIAKLVGLIWLFLLVIFSIGFVAGIIIEIKLSDTSPVKKWWRKHIVAPDPSDTWKNIDF
jgi:hypothetical protein